MSYILGVKEYSYTTGVDGIDNINSFRKPHTYNNELYIASQTNYIDVLDMATGELLRTVTLTHNFTGFFIDQVNGNIITSRYLGSSLSNQLFIYNNTGTLLSSFTHTPGENFGNNIELDTKNNRIWATFSSEFSSDAVLRVFDYNRNTNTITFNRDISYPYPTDEIPGYTYYANDIVYDNINNQFYVTQLTETDTSTYPVRVYDADTFLEKEPLILSDTITSRGVLYFDKEEGNLLICQTGYSSPSPTDFKKIYICDLITKTIRDVIETEFDGFIAIFVSKKNSEEYWFWTTGFANQPLKTIKRNIV